MSLSRRCLLALAVVAPAAVTASSIIERTVGERAREADRVVLAEVLESRTVVPGEDPRRMYTLTTVRVGEHLKGQGPERLEIVQLGGRSGPWEAHVAGDAVFRPGELALLLLRCRGEGARCNLMALGEGKLTVIGDDVLVRSLARGSYTRRTLASVREEIARALEAPPEAGR